MEGAQSTRRVGALGPQRWLSIGSKALGTICAAVFISILTLGGAAHALTPTTGISWCNATALMAAAPPGVVVGDIADLNTGLPATTNGVADVPAGFFESTSPEECLVTGTVVTNPATGKTANFAALLPAKSKWNRRFMFTGCGGNCGTAMSSLPTADVLNKGFPVWSTDDGHAASDLIWPTTSPGQLDNDSVIDFAYRAVHRVTVLGKQFTLNIYNAPAFAYSYFEGCSDGGREAIVEANRYPSDYNGILAGDPYFDVGGQNIILSNDTVQLRASDALVSPALMQLASQIVTQKCDAYDGVTDGLIQDPELCDFNPQTDLPRCTSSVTTNCFTQDQIDSLSSMLTAMTDKHGRVIHPGFSESDMHTDLPGFSLDLALWAGVATPPVPASTAPWGVVLPNFDWMINGSGIYYWAYLGEASPNNVSTLGFTYRSGGPGKINFFHTVAPDNTIQKIYGAMNIASGDFPQELEPFINRGGKLILYHGFSDGLITPYRTIQYFRELADINGGYRNLGRSVRLFMVPGMFHCAGGPGPNDFGQAGEPPVATGAQYDATTALVRWTEEGVAPSHFIATEPISGRTMPLCPYPAEAQYKGTGNVNDAASWFCPRHGDSLLATGLDGKQAGVNAPLYTPGEHFKIY